MRLYTWNSLAARGRWAAVNGMQVGRLPWGAEHHRAYRGPSCHRTSMAAICEELPEEHNTVTLVPC